MTRLNWAIAVCMATAWCNLASADVKLPKIFGDHMVLQQKAEVAVWGWADPEEEVNVTFGDSKASTKAQGPPRSDRQGQE
jgi:sialate O-acetylesterase